MRFEIYNINEKKINVWQMIKLVDWKTLFWYINKSWISQLYELHIATQNIIFHSLTIKSKVIEIKLGGNLYWIEINRFIKHNAISVHNSLQVGMEPQAGSRHHLLVQGLEGRYDLCN